jgi:hypothetical protein
MKGNNPMFASKTIRLALALALLGTMLSALSVSAAPADRSTSMVQKIPGGMVVPGASSSLVRTDNGISMTINTSQLDPHAVHTVWWVIFNNPEHCVDGCGPDDAMRPETNASVFYAAGTIVGASGKASFAAHVRQGVYPGPVDGVSVIDVDGPGLLYPRTAEVHLVIRTHGEPIPGIVDGMLHSFNVGCPASPVDPGPNECKNVQVALHSAP